MKLTSAECSKILKKLTSEYEALLRRESLSSTYLASVGENPEDCRPEYDYEETAKEIEEKETKIRKIRHALNIFNATTVVPKYDITIDEILMIIPQLSKRKEKLTAMAGRNSKARVENHFSRSNIIDYEYTNYDIKKVSEDLSRVTDELSNAQLALDRVNHIATLEIDI